MKQRMTILALVAVAFMIGCSKELTPSGPNSFGSIDKSVYVAVGNSLTAGYQDGALFEEGQMYSFPKLLADQLGTSFVQPLMPAPGTGSRMRLMSLTTDPPTIVTDAPALTPPSNSSHPVPFNNLGIPGAIAFDGLDTSEIGKKSFDRKNPFFSLVLRNQQAFGVSQVIQAIKLHPTVMTLWLGNNDILGYATSGGVSPSTLLPSSVFDAIFGNTVRAILDSLPNISLICANIPDVKVIPFFTTMGPKIGLKLGVINASLAYQMHGEVGPGTGQTRLIPGAGDALITLQAAPYAGLLGQATGKWYRDLAARLGVPLPAVIGANVDTTKPFGLDPRNPWPDALILDYSELQQISKATSEYNARITAQINQIQTSRNTKIGLVDIYSRFNDIHAHGISVAGETLTTAYIAGGLFGLDGVHPTNKGAGVIANEFIKVMNSTFGSNIPMVDISRLPGLTAPLGKHGLNYDLSWNIPPHTFDNVIRLFHP